MVLGTEATDLVPYPVVQSSWVYEDIVQSTEGRRIALMPNMAYWIETFMLIYDRSSWAVIVEVIPTCSD